jgi:peptidoglycan hydrolase-like protein with peptidoglycan-binding domain
VTKIEIKKGEFTSWEEVLCPVDINDYTIMQLQNALRERGYDPGPADNLLGDKTKAALTRYQKENDLPVGQLDMKTLTTLGIIK